jgi:DNA-binding winged helix-turn-helix (wHTH) protein/tetratricopeptide (TPR) repeat protein
MMHTRYRFGRFTLDLAKRELRADAAPVPLPARVFECLAHLIEHRDRAVDRDELAQAVFARRDVSDAQLAQIILRSRRTLGDDGHEQRTIRTVPRYGYRWIAETRVEQVATHDDAVAASPPAPPRDAEGDADGDAATLRDRDVAAAAATRFARDAIAAAVPSVPAPRIRARNFAVAAGALLALVAIVGVWSWRWHAAPPPAARSAPIAQRALMVLPLRVNGPRDAAWARLGLMDYLADRMRRAGLPTLASDTTLGLLRDAADARALPDAAQLRRSARVDWIVEGDAQNGDGVWQVRLRATDTHGLVQRGAAQGRDLLDATRVAGDRLLAALGGEVPGADAPEPGLAERLQRAQSAMLANELDTARRILNEAPELQRARPQLRYRLAQVDFRAGAYARGLATLDELLGGADAQADPMFRARLHNSRGAMLIRLDRYAEAERDYDAAIALLEGGGAPVELGHALNGRGVTRSSQGRFEPALDDLGRARMQLLQGGDALAVARVDANLGNVEMDRERPAQALGYFRKAVRDFESMGAVNELAGTGGMLLAADLQLLQAGAALRDSDRLWALLPRLRDPAQRANVMLDRAEALLAVGRLGEAGQLLADPETGRVVPGDYKRRDVLRVELARQSRDFAAAARLADAALADWPPERRPRLRAWLQLARARAAQALDLPYARDAVLGDGVPERLLRAIQHGAGRDAAAAEADYGAALDLAVQRAIPAEIAGAVEVYADWLFARGDAVRVGGLIGRVAPWAEQDFDLAVLQVALYARLGQRAPWEAALQRAQRLAGERPIPVELRAPTFAPSAAAASP